MITLKSKENNKYMYKTWYTIYQEINMTWYNYFPITEQSMFTGLGIDTYLHLNKVYEIAVWHLHSTGNLQVAS